MAGIYQSILRTQLAFTVIAFIALSFVASRGAFAQVVISRGIPMIATAPSSAPQAAVTAPGSPVPAEGPAAPEGEAAAEEQESPEDKLVKKLLATKLDRTTQSVLKAWSFREPKPKKTESKKEPTIYEATVSNAFGSVVVFSVEKETKLKPDNIIVIKQADKELARANILSIDGLSIVAKLKPIAKPKTKKTDSTKSTKSGEQPKPKKETSAKKQPPAKTDSSKTKESENGDDKADESTTTDSGTTANRKETKQPDTDAAESTTDKSESKDTKKPETKSFPKLTPNSAVTITIAPKKADKEKDEEAQAKKKVEAFVRNVTLANWSDVQKLLAELTPENGDKVYGHLLKSLSKSVKSLPEGIPPEMAQQLAQMNRRQPPPTSFLAPNDILELSEIAPKPIQIEIKKKKDKSEEGSEKTAKAKPSLPPGISLPAGMSIESLPPEALASLQKATAGVPGAQPTEATEEKEQNHLPALAKLISIAKKEGHDFTDFVTKLESGTKHFGVDDRIKRLTTAALLMKSRLTDDVDTFLPGLDDEKTKTDFPALKIWSELALTRHSDKKVAEWLEKAWQINQWIVAIEDVEKKDRDKALTNLIELSPKVDKELGQAWINSSFTEEPERGMMILTNLGTKSATMAKQAASVSESRRFKLLSLQNKAVENLINVSPEKAGDWAQAMTLLAKNWLTEAEISLQYSKENSRRSYMNIDMYGNYYWVDQNDYNQRYGGQRNPRPIKIGDMIEILPSETWKEHVSPSLHTQLRKVTANLHLRVNEEDKAFPFIEEIAPDHPEIAKDLIHQFLEIWTRNHDPNTDKRERNPYIYFYGFDQKAEAIPLTRSKQERNLVELKGWVDRIRKMDNIDVDEELLANAFTTCHSSAEVFKLEAVKSVFGNLGELKPDTVAAICQKMRNNLSAAWRDVRNQEAKQTKRRLPEVQQEVLRGYDVAMKLAEESLAAEPDSWELHLAKACLMYDQNAYSQSVQKSSEFSDRRDTAFVQFALAAEKYGDAAPTLEEKDQSTDVYDYWFYAALGACDLGKITDKTIPDLRQYPKIKEAILGLDGQLAEDHMAKVANNMFTRMSPIKPEIKFRYLRGGFVIVGDHPRAWEARNLYDYYKDLVSELKLHVAVDGNEDVGHDQAFGVYVSLLHTSEIERESGGFAKYVQNQNSMMYSFNYGRPTEDYRDKFNDAVNQALEKHYEILNVTFQSADAMESIPAPEEGWRLTPYAYILLKAKGSEVDRIAPLKVDMDFLDTSGYVVIPVESPAIVIDCSSESPSPRPIEDLQITQTLDERQADESRLILEISATAKGLVPELEDIVDLKREEFEVVSIDDQGVLPSSFDEDSATPQILSDRSWTVEYKAKDGSSQPEAFSFSESKLADAGVKFQRYEDADLVEVDKAILLEKSYGSFSWGFLYWLIPAIVLGLCGIAGLIYSMNKPAEIVADRFQVPEDVNPFTVLTLLKDIRQRNGISDEKAVELDRSINRVEEYYFGRSDSEEQQQDLSALANQWVQRAK